MNAIQFIKEQGVEKAREVVSGAPDGATHFLYDAELDSADYLKHVPCVSEFSFDLWDAGEWKPFLRTKKRIDLSDLKRIVESVDLIDSLGGLELSKKESNNCRFYEYADMSHRAYAIKQARA